MGKTCCAGKTAGCFKQVAASIKAGAAKVARAVGMMPQVGPEEFNRLVTHKAYELYSKRGADQGNDKSDWVEAERLVRAELGL